MFNRQYFSLARQMALFLMIALAWPLAAYCAPAGHVDFAVGQVSAVAADGSPRALQKGSEINAGDAISTAAGARAQIRFSDGGFIALQPGSQFRVDQYNYEGKTDGKEKSFFSLLKGGLRAITGAVGHVNRESYKVATPAATIGIRGTGYHATLSDGLLVTVSEGVVSLTNNAGSLVVNAGQGAFVANFDTLPVLNIQGPQAPPGGLLPPSPGPGYTPGEQRDPAGKPIIVPPPSPPPPPQGGQ